MHTHQPHHTHITHKHTILMHSRASCNCAHRRRMSRITITARARCARSSWSWWPKKNTAIKLPSNEAPLHWSLIILYTLSVFGLWFSLYVYEIMLYIWIVRWKSHLILQARAICVLFVVRDAMIIVRLSHIIYVVWRIY